MLLVIAGVIYLFKVDQAAATEIIKNSVTPVLAFLGTVLGIHEIKDFKSQELDTATIDPDTTPPPGFGDD